MNPGGTSDRPVSNRRLLVLWILAFMILVNISVRYPLYNAVPHGSDSFFTLELGKSLADDGRAQWILAPLSYVGYFPLSYPSGTPFLFSEFHILTDANWNSVPLTFSMLFTVLMVLAGFLLFRAFKLGDIIPAILSGLMALSPMFIYYTYEQATGRGFVIPFLVLALGVVFLRRISPLSRYAVVVLILGGCFTIHRSGFIVLFFVVAAIISCQIVPPVRWLLPSKSHRVRATLYSMAILLMALLVIWPYVPVLDDIFASIPGMQITARVAEVEFQTGFLLEGDSVPVILVNMATNYAGSFGVLVLLLPFGLIGLYPRRRFGSEHDVFLIFMLILISPFLWKAGYVQPVILPLAYILVGVALKRRSRIWSLIQGSLAFVDFSRVMNSRRMRRAMPTAVSVVMASVMISSFLLFEHRANMPWPATEVMVWPTDEVANLGTYMNVESYGGEELFVSQGVFLDRQIRWFSGWDSPVTDPAILKVHGHLNATRGDFIFVSENQQNPLGFLLSFYDLSSDFDVSSSLGDQPIYTLSFMDVYGLYRLYYNDSHESIFSPRISTDEAGVTLLIEVNDLGDRIPQIYPAKESIASPFLETVSTSAYMTYQSEHYSAFLTAHVSSWG